MGWLRRRFTRVPAETVEDAIAPAPATENNWACARRFSYPECKVGANASQSTGKLRHAQSLVARRTGGLIDLSTQRVGLCVPVFSGLNWLHEPLYGGPLRYAFCERDWGGKRPHPTRLVCAGYLGNHVRSWSQPPGLGRQNGQQWEYSLEDRLSTVSRISLNRLCAQAAGGLFSAALFAGLGAPVWRRVWRSVAGRHSWKAPALSAACRSNSRSRQRFPSGGNFAGRAPGCCFVTDVRCRRELASTSLSFISLPTSSGAAFRAPRPVCFGCFFEAPGAVLRSIDFCSGWFELQQTTTQIRRISFAARRLPEFWLMAFFRFTVRSS